MLFGFRKKIVARKCQVSSRVQDVEGVVMSLETCVPFYDTLTTCFS